MTRTNAHALLTVGLRLVAAYYLVTSLATVIGQFFFTPGDMVDMARYYWFVQLGACVLFALLWLLADRVAAFGLASRSAPQFESDIDAQHWLAVGIALIGVWATADNFASLCYYGALKWSMTRPSETLEHTNFDAQARAQIFACIVQFIVGAWMVLKARGLAYIIHRIRFAGVSADADRARRETE